MTHPSHQSQGGKLSLSVGATAMVLLALVVYPPVAAQTPEAGDAELRNVMNVYAEAVNKADAQLGSKVWCGSEEDSVTNPTGHWQGTQQIKALYALLGDSYSERKLTFDTVSIHSYGDFAWTEFTGDFAAKAAQRWNAFFLPCRGNTDLSQVPRQVVPGPCSILDLPRATFSQSSMSVNA